jgi:hypothetical protein
MRLHELGVTCRATESDPFCPQSAIGTSGAGMGCPTAVAWNAGAPRSSRRSTQDDRCFVVACRRTRPPGIAGTKMRHHFYKKLVLTSVTTATIFLNIDRPKAGPTSNGRTIRVP